MQQAMSLVRISEVTPVEGYRLRLRLTNGQTIERDVGGLLLGPIFDAVKSDPQFFRQVRAEGGTVVWPNGADLCPDVLIWGGPPPEVEREDRAPAELGA